MLPSAVKDHKVALFYRLLAAYKLHLQTSTPLLRQGPAVKLASTSGRDGIPCSKCIEEFCMSRMRPLFAVLTRRIIGSIRRPATESCKRNYPNGGTPHKSVDGVFSKAG
jgi:hypothetical protein